MHDIGVTIVGGSTFESYSPDVTNAVFTNTPAVLAKFGYRATGTLAGYASQSTPILSGPGNNSNTSLFISEISNYQRPCLLMAGQGNQNNYLAYIILRLVAGMLGYVME